jgi:hypothetical protein
MSQQGSISQNTTAPNFLHYFCPGTLGDPFHASLSGLPLLHAGRIVLQHLNVRICFHLMQRLKRLRLLHEKKGIISALKCALGSWYGTARAARRIWS